MTHINNIQPPKFPLVDVEVFQNFMASAYPLSKRGAVKHIVTREEKELSQSYNAIWKRAKRASALSARNIKEQTGKRGMQ